MKKLLYLIILLSISLNSYGLNFLDKDSKIDAGVINRIGTLYVEEKYKDCIDSCNNYLDYRYFVLGYRSHPYRDWRKDHGYWETNDVMNVSKVLYLGCAAAYQYSLSNYDSNSIFDRLEWARACVAVYDDYLHERIPNEESTIETWEQYIQYAENALAAAECGDHFLTTYSDDKWSKKQEKWFDKKRDRILNVLYTINGSKPLSKRKTVYETVRQYIEKHPTDTFNDILSVFPRELQGHYGVIIDEDEYTIRHDKSSDIDRRYFAEIPLTDCSDKKIYVCSQRGPNFDVFRKHVKEKLGWEIKEIL